MLRFYDSAVPLGSLPERNRAYCLPTTQTGSTHEKGDVGAGYPLGELACMYLCCGYTRGVTAISVQLEASVTG